MRKRGLPLLLAALLLLSACGGGGEAAEPDGVKLWFAVDSASQDYGHGPALACEPYQPPESQIGPPEGETEPNPGALLEALLAGPTREGLVSPFPRGVTLNGWDWDGERPGILLVDLSEQYGALADISLSLADYSIVLTLSQAEGVEGVEITAGGRRVSYRSHQTLDLQEAVLRDELAQKTLDNAADSQ